MDDYKEIIKNLFRQQRCKAGEILPMRSVQCLLIDRLNPEETKNCIESINSLIKDGFCIYEEEGFKCLRLTEKGYEGLYPKMSVIELEELIMDLFRKSKCKIGEGIMTRNFYNLQQKLNPEDSKSIIDVVNRLIQGGYIVYERETSDFLKLTEKGYNRIYK